jgi:transcriptional regulator with XRE-family HTH domain
MPSFQITISPTRRSAARFIASVRRAIQQALAEEYKERGLTQSEIARIIKVHRSVINREIRGDKDLTLGRIGELAHALGRHPTFSLPKKKQRDGVNVVPAAVSIPILRTPALTKDSGNEAVRARLLEPMGA